MKESVPELQELTNVSKYLMSREQVPKVAHGRQPDVQARVVETRAAQIAVEGNVVRGADQHLGQYDAPAEEGDDVKESSPVSFRDMDAFRSSHSPLYGLDHQELVGILPEWIEHRDLKAGLEEEIIDSGYSRPFLPVGVSNLVSWL